MAIKMSVAVRNARLNAIETTIGTTAVLVLRTGAAPANITDADSGTAVATLTLPSDWMAAASAGAKALTGTWTNASVVGSATPVAHFRLYASDGTTQHMQGTVTATSGGGDMEIQNTTIAATQAVTVTAFTLTDGNA